LKKDVNVSSKSNKKKNKNKKLFFVGILKVYDENSRIRIHTKMSWIRNTDGNEKEMSNVTYVPLNRTSYGDLSKPHFFTEVTIHQ
jgi:hypothetical protein